MNLTWLLLHKNVLLFHGRYSHMRINIEPEARCKMLTERVFKKYELDIKSAAHVVTNCASFFPNFVKAFKSY